MKNYYQMELPFSSNWINTPFGYKWEGQNCSWDFGVDPIFRDLSKTIILKFDPRGPMYCTCTYQSSCDSCKKEQSGHSSEDVKNTFTELIKHFESNFGYKPNKEELEQTPRRLYQMYEELLSGYSMSPQDILSKVFEQDYKEIVAQKDIEFVSLCSHHWMPFKGVVHFGYLPNNKRIVGLSKIPRLVECFARRFQSQEQMTQQIVDSFMENIDPEGCIAISEAEHLCYQIRGPKSKAKTIVSAVRGCFANNQDIKSEFMRMIGK